MTDAGRTADPEGRFDLVLPPGWAAAPDPDEGGLEVAREDGEGALHLISFEAEADAFPDPAEELFAFLDERGVELEEDEVEDVSLEGDAELSLCEYVAEDDEGADGDEEPTFWLVGVATAPGTLVFATYLCPAGEEDAERDAVRALLSTLRLNPGG
jgi:hypothetical protein